MASQTHLLTFTHSITTRDNSQALSYLLSIPQTLEDFFLKGLLPIISRYLYRDFNTGRSTVAV